MAPLLVFMWDIEMLAGGFLSISSAPSYACVYPTTSYACVYPTTSYVCGYPIIYVVQNKPRGESIWNLASILLKILY